MYPSTIELDYLAWYVKRDLAAVTFWDAGKNYVSSNHVHVLLLKPPGRLRGRVHQGGVQAGP